MKVGGGVSKMNNSHNIFLEGNCTGNKQEIQEFKTKLAEISDIRWDKVKEIKKAVKNGEYNIDPRQVARRMLEGIDLERQW